LCSSGTAGHIEASAESTLTTRCQVTSEIQSLNRYAYVLNNPTSLIDPTGLQCVTLDDGNIGDDGTSPPCGNVTGDSPGETTVYGGSPPCMYTDGYGCGYGNRNPQSNSGNLVSGSGTISPAPQPRPDVPLPPFAKAVFSKVYQTLNGLDPEPCGGGTFGFRGAEGNLGAAKGGGYVIVTRDSQSGTTVGTLIEAGAGPVSVGRETAVNPTSGSVNSGYLLFVGAGGGAFFGFGNNQIQLGLYGSANVVGGGAYVNLVPGGTCGTNKSGSAGGDVPIGG